MSQEEYLLADQPSELDRLQLQSRTLSEDELASLRRQAETELAERGRWGTTFTLIQSWGRR
jgi:hypothetical protein